MYACILVKNASVPLLMSHDSFDETWLLPSLFYANNKNLILLTKQGKDSQYLKIQLYWCLAHI